MAKKKSKLATPAWITEGYDSPAEYEKAHGGEAKKKKEGKTFNLRQCPECESDDVGVALGEVGIWECRKCKYKGEEIKEKELTEDEFMKYLDEKGEEVA
jgi:ribosomal protein L37AE/L43A